MRTRTSALLFCEDAASMACEFCDGTWRGDLVLEDETGSMILHEDWSPRGHAMVVSKRHLQNASDLGALEWEALASLYRRAERAVLEATGRERAIMLKLGIQVPHLHIHIYPANASHDRAAVMAMMGGKARDERDPSFVERMRHAMIRQ
jgi:diadenosine tetraphosphate (Ap4A) HIT family hydrolase